MALINCPDCNRQVSDKAPACNGCGYPIMPTQLTTCENSSNIYVSKTTPSETNDINEAQNNNTIKTEYGVKHNKKNSAIRNLAGILLGIASILLLVQLFVLIDIRSLSYPSTVILPTITLTIFWIGSLLLLLSARTRYKGYDAKKQTIIAVVLIAVAIIMFPISQSINSSIQSSSPDSNSLVQTDIPDPTPTPSPAPSPTPSPTPTPETSNHNLIQSMVFPCSEMIAFASLAFADGENINFYNTPDIIFTTTDAENELDGTFMYIKGTLQTFDVTANEFLFALVQTDMGMIALGLLMDLFDLGIENGLLTKPIDVDFLREGQEYGFFFLYTGYSKNYEMPAGMFVGIDRESIPDVELTFGDTFIFDGHEITIHDEIQWIVISDERSIFRIPMTITRIQEERANWETWNNVYLLSPNGTERRVGNSARQQFDFTTYWEQNFMLYDLGYIRTMQPNDTVITHVHFLYEGEGDYTVSFIGRQNTIDDIKVILPIPEAPTRATNTPTPPPRGINAETYSHLKTGMSISQVRTIMGIEPSSELTSTHEILGTRTYSTILDWTRFNPYRSITVGFSGTSASHQTVSSLISTNID